MVFFNVRKEYCTSEKQLVKITSNWASLLLNGNVQVQNYPVSYSCMNHYLCLFHPRHCSQYWLITSDIYLVNLHAVLS